MPRWLGEPTPRAPPRPCAVPQPWRAQPFFAATRALKGIPVINLQLWFDRKLGSSLDGLAGLCVRWILATERSCHRSSSARELPRNQDAG